VAFFWLQSQVSTFTAPGGSLSLGYPPLTIPANGRLVKILHSNISFCWKQSGSHDTDLGLWSIQQQIHFTSGPYSGKTIRWQRNAVESMLMSTFNDVGIIPQFTGYYQGGDERHGFNQKTSYGGTGKGASVLQPDIKLVEIGAALGTSQTNFYYAGQFQALYEL
jgi:hypothetical protein